MTDGQRVLLCDRGNLRFTWNIVSRQAEVYEMNGSTPVKRIAWLLVAPGDGAGIEFEQAAFDRFCDEFLEMAATAEIRDETEGPGDPN